MELPEVPTDWRGKCSKEWLIPWEVRTLGETFHDGWSLPEGILGHFPDQKGEVYEIDGDFSKVSEEWNRIFWNLPVLRDGYHDKNWLQREYGAVWGAMLWEALRPGSMALAVKTHMEPRVIPVRVSQDMVKVGRKVAAFYHGALVRKTMVPVKKVGEQRFFSQIGRNRGCLSREEGRWLLVIQRPSPSPRENTLYNPWKEIMAEWACLKKAGIVPRLPE